MFQNGRPNSKRVSPKLSLDSGHGGRNNNAIYIMIDACFSDNIHQGFNVIFFLMTVLST